MVVHPPPLSLRFTESTGDAMLQEMWRGFYRTYTNQAVGTCGKANMTAGVECGASTSITTRQLMDAFYIPPRLHSPKTWPARRMKPKQLSSGNFQSQEHVKTKVLHSVS